MVVDGIYPMSIIFEDINYNTKKEVYGKRYNKLKPI